jgi:hypothetical protein
MLLNTTENQNGWDQLQEWLEYRLVPDLSKLKDHIQRGLDAINEPNIRSSLTDKDLS